ncbi:MAG: hypothetical protein GC136_02605 [Alphaproteobacteria bacterium]|nr:hypothetical protein [Alphaproteobacteria bacterium]
MSDNRNNDGFEDSLDWDLDEELDAQDINEIEGIAPTEDVSGGEELPYAKSRIKKQKGLVDYLIIGGGVVIGLVIMLFLFGGGGDSSAPQQQNAQQQQQAGVAPEPVMQEQAVPAPQQAGLEAVPPQPETDGGMLNDPNLLAGIQPPPQVMPEVAPPQPEQAAPVDPLLNPTSPDLSAQAPAQVNEPMPTPVDPNAVVAEPTPVPMADITTPQQPPVEQVTPDIQAQQLPPQEVAQPAPDASADVAVAFEQRITRIEQQIIEMQNSVQSQNNANDMQAIRDTLARLEQRLNETANVAEQAKQQAASKPAAKAAEPADDEPAPAPVKKAASKPKPKPASETNTWDKPYNPNNAAPASPSTGISGPATRGYELRSAQPDVAYISKSGSDTLQAVRVGDNVPGIGTVKAITAQNGVWVVIGTQGTIRP